MKLPPAKSWPPADIMVGLPGQEVDRHGWRYYRNAQVPVEVIVPSGLTLFHGTSSAQSFSIPRGPASFSLDAKTAQGYADHEGEGINPRVLTFQTKRPLKCLDHPGVGNPTANEDATFWIERIASEVHGIDYREMRDWGMVGAMRIPEFLSFLEGIGYDGLVIRKLDDGGTEVAIFKPEESVKPLHNESRSIRETRNNSIAMVVVPSDPPGRNISKFLRDLSKNRSKLLVVGQSGKLAPGNLSDLLKSQLPDVTKIEVIDMAETGGESISDAMRALEAEGLYKSGQALEIFAEPDVARRFQEEMRSTQTAVDPTVIRVVPTQVPTDDWEGIMQAFQDGSTEALRRFLDPHIFSDPDRLAQYKAAIFDQGGGLMSYGGSSQPFPSESKTPYRPSVTRLRKADERGFVKVKILDAKRGRIAVTVPLTLSKQTGIAWGSFVRVAVDDRGFSLEKAEGDAEFDPESRKVQSNGILIVPAQVRDYLSLQPGSLLYAIADGAVVRFELQLPSNESVVREASSKKKVLSPQEVERLYPTALVVWDRDVPEDERQDETTFYTFQKGWNKDETTLAARTPKHIWQFRPPVEVGEEPPDPGRHPATSGQQVSPDVAKDWETASYERWSYQSRLKQAREVGPDGRWQVVQRTPVQGTKARVEQWAKSLGRPFTAAELRQAWSDAGGNKRNMWDLVQRMPLTMVHDHTGRQWNGMDNNNVYEYTEGGQGRETSEVDRWRLCPKCSRAGAPARSRGAGPGTIYRTDQNGVWTAIQRRDESVVREFLTDLAPSREIAIQVLHDLLAAKLQSANRDIHDYEYLGSGRNGSAYRGPDGLILKVTTDPEEARSAIRLKGVRSEYIHSIYGVAPLSEGVWLIAQEGGLEKLPEHYSEEFDLAMEVMETVGAMHHLRFGRWDEALECLSNASVPEVVPDVVEVCLKFGVPGMCEELQIMGLSGDFHSGNIMLREGVPVLTDLGTPGDAPGPVREGSPGDSYYPSGTFVSWEQGPDWWRDLHHLVEVIIDAKRSAAPPNQLRELLFQYEDDVLGAFEQSKAVKTRKMGRLPGQFDPTAISVPEIEDDEISRQLHRILDLTIGSFIPYERGGVRGESYVKDWIDYFNDVLKAVQPETSQISKEAMSGGPGLSEAGGLQAAPSAGAAGHLKGMGSSAWSGGRGVLAKPVQNVPIDPEEDEYSAALDWGFYGADR